MYLDRGDLGYGGIHAGLAHFVRIYDRQRRLLFEGLDPAVPELGLVVERVQDGRRVPLADPTIDADRSGPAVAESAGGIVTGTARHGPIRR